MVQCIFIESVAWDLVVVTLCHWEHNMSATVEPGIHTTKPHPPPLSLSSLPLGMKLRYFFQNPNVPSPTGTEHLPKKTSRFSELLGLDTSWSWYPTFALVQGLLEQQYLNFPQGSNVLEKDQCNTLAETTLVGYNWILDPPLGQLWPFVILVKYGFVVELPW